MGSAHVNQKTKCLSGEIGLTPIHARNRRLTNPVSMARAVTASFG
jgi:hypothetical protein